MSSTVSPSSFPILPVPYPQRVSLTDLLKSDRCPDFAAFTLNQGYSTFGVVVCALHSIMYPLAAFLADKEGVPVSSKWILRLRCICPLLGWVYYYFASRHVLSIALTTEGKRLLRLGNAVILLYAAFMAAQILGWVLTRGDCHSDACLQNYPKNVLPSGLLNAAFATSIGAPVFFVSSTSVCFLALFINISAVLIAAGLLKLSPSEIFGICLVGVIFSLILAAYKGGLLSIHTSYSKFKVALRESTACENSKYLMKVQTEEMCSMIGNVAHDLRTPLQALKSEISILQESIRDEIVDKALLLTSITQLDNICNNMAMAINRSIDFTKASSGIKLKPTISSVNFSKLLHWAAGCMTNLHSRASLVIRPIPDSIDTRILTDKQWLMENLLCLLSNAQKFTTEGEITVQCSLSDAPRGVVAQNDIFFTCDKEENDASDIEACLEADKKMILIEVEDTGIGITEENRKILFEPFSQAQRRTGGTGLGLYALSKRIESLGGDCGVSNRRDGARGSRFWITLPFKPDHKWDMHSVSSGRNLTLQLTPVDNSSTPSSSSISFMPLFGRERTVSSELMENSSRASEVPPAAELQPCRKLKILLVDDSPMIRKATSRALVKAGHEVEVAQDGADGIRMLEGSKLSPHQYGIDLVLMDLQMPVMGGLEATREIRALEETVVQQYGVPASSHHVVIIGVTASTAGEARDDCMESGMDGFIEKPLEIVFFQEIVAKMRWPSVPPE